MDQIAIKRRRQMRASAQLALVVGLGLSVGAPTLASAASAGQCHLVCSAVPTPPKPVTPSPCRKVRAIVRHKPKRVRIAVLAPLPPPPTVVVVTAPCPPRSQASVPADYGSAVQNGRLTWQGKPAP